MTQAAQPKISVCLPTFNGAKYVGEAIESVLNQSFVDFELVICDDRSTDDTEKIVATFAASDRRIKFSVNPERLGLFRNYNECLSRCRGEFIKPFAQDDLLDRSMLERMIRAIGSYNGITLVSTAKRWINAGGHEIKRMATFDSDTVLPGKDVIMAHLIRLTNWVGEPSTVMFPAGAIGDKFDTSFYHYGDIEYWLRILDRGSLLYLSEPLCSFRRHEESSTSANLKGLYFAADFFRLGTKYQRYLKELGETPEHFGQRAAEVIALQLNHLVTKEGLTVETAVTAAPPIPPDACGADEAIFRQALFYSERRITSLLEELITTRNKLEHKEGECQTLQAALNQLTNSVSWKLTEPLRHLRTKMGPSPR